jgi:hypothetical protein
MATRITAFYKTSFFLSMDGETTWLIDHPEHAEPSPNQQPHTQDNYRIAPAYKNTK